MSSRLIFCLSTGRCGTMWLSKVLNTVPDVWACHEPFPNFMDMHTKPYDERRSWLKAVKIPHIQGVAQPTHIETSNLVNQGFIEPLWELGIDFELLYIKRDLQQVALSQWRRGGIPGRTAGNKTWGLQPENPNNRLTVENYSHWTDYTSCLWHAMEKTARNDYYASHHTGPVHFVEYTEMVTGSGLANLCQRLGIGQAEHIAKRYNSTEEHKANVWPIEGFGNQAQVIRDTLKANG